MSEKVEIVIQAIDQATQSVRGVTREFNALGAAGSNAANGMVGSFNNFSTAMNGVNRKVSNTVSVIDRASKSIAAFSKKLLTFGAGGIFGSAAIADDYAGFNTTMASAGAMVKATSKEVKEMEAIVKSAAAATGKGAVDIAKGVYYIGSANQKITEDMTLFDSTMNLSIGTMSNMEQAVRTINSIMGQFSMSAEQAGKASDVLAYGISNSANDLSSMDSFFRQAGATAGSFGKSIEEVAAAAMVLADAGQIGEIGGTAFRNILLQVGTAAGPAKEALDQLNISMAEIDPKKTRIDGIVKIFEEAEPSAKQLVTIFGKESFTAFQNLMAIGSEALGEIIDGAEAATGKAAEMAKAINEADGTKWNKIVQSMKNIAYDVGPAVIEAFEGMVKPLQEISGFFKDLGIEADLVKGIVQAMGAALVVGLGGQVLSGGMKLLNVVTKIGTFFGFAGAAAAGLGTGVVALGAAATALVGLDIKLFSDAKNIRETALATGELNQTMIALSQVRVQMPDLEKYINSLAEAVAETGDMAKSEALDFVVNGMITPEFMVEFNEKNNVSGEIQDTYNHFISEFRSGFDLSDDVKLDLSAAISADTASFAQKMDNVVKATSGASEVVKANLDSLASTAKDAGKRFSQFDDEFNIETVWDPDTESFVVSFEKIENVVEQQLQSAADKANEGVEKVTTAISQLWNETDEEGKASGPLAGVRQDIEQDVQDIQKLLDTMNLNKMGISFDKLGADLTNMISEDMQMDIAETQLKLQMESLLNTVYDSTGKIPEEMKKLGEQIDMAWWTDMVSEITGTNVDMSGVVDGVKSGSEKMSEELNKFKDYGVQIKPEWKTEELEKIAEQLTKRRNLTVPEINVIGSNITKHRVQIVLDLNKESFMKQWSSLGLNMTSTLENSLLYD